MIHQCTVCGERGEWNPSWEWFGSLRDLDDGTILIKTCSPECKSMIDDPEKMHRDACMELGIKTRRGAK